VVKYVCKHVPGPLFSLNDRLA